MVRRLGVVVVVTVFCIFSIIFGAALLSEAVAPSAVEELLQEQPDFREGELERLGSDDDPIGYGGEPGALTDFEDIHVRYGAVAEPYWRTASYATYTGSTWRRAENASVSAFPSDPPGGSSQTFRIESWGANSILPAPWRPVSIGDEVADSVTVRPDGSFAVTEDLAPGRTAMVTSELPDWTYDELANSEFPSDVPAVYTTVPANLPDRLAARTSEITADAETPYGTAVLVERWLKLSKDYSPNATTSTDWAADEFVFDRENGTSELFTTAMVAMLRTQNVPARYVTGFAPGERIETGEEVVRGRHAHAWVEVYFENLGWVTFDPTPPERILDRNESLDASGEVRSGQASTTDTPQFLSVTDGSVSRGPKRATSEGADIFAPRGMEPVVSDGWEPVDPAPDVAFLDGDGNRLSSLIPGTTVVIEVTRDGEPLQGHRVSFDSVVVGVTDDDGRVTATVPYVDSISVLVEKPVPTDSDDDDGDSDDGDGDENGDGDGDDGEGDGDNGSGTVGDGDGFTHESGYGALDPGEETGVGGDLGLDPGTFATTDTSVHLRVESSQPTYWRSDAYDRFTGMGWERTGGSDPLDGDTADVGTAPGSDDRTRIEYEVTLERRARALPTAWEPATVSGVENLSMTDRGGFRSESVLGVGTTYEGTSFAPTDDVERLRDARGEDPPNISERYTQLPANTSERLAQLSGELTADQPTRFDAAMAVQRWLREEKEYSLQASASGAGIADEFVFEMDAGYCEYFATAMVAMLRTQDIPARYVVGYSPGDEVGDGVYEVRGMNAHAWVEVYFPDVGWVTFDPTPGDERLATQEEALREEDPDADYRTGGEGSPGESFRPGEIQRQTDQIIDASDYEVGGYADHLDAPDEVVIGEEREPFSDQIRFIVSPVDDETTVESLADTGTGETTLESLAETGPGETTVESLAEADPGGTTVESLAADGQGGQATTDGSRTATDRGRLDGLVASGGIGGGTRVHAAVRSPGHSTPHPDSPQLRQDGEEINFSIETDIDVALGDETRSGQSVTLTATINGVPVPNARVESRTFDRRTVLTTARTDDNGQAALEVPYHERVRILVRRGAASGAATHEVDVDLDLAVEGDPHPGATVPVTVTSHGEPASGVTVSPGGNETGPNGTATATTPYTSEGEIVAERGSARATRAFSVQPRMTVTGDPVVGSEVQVEVTADGRPVDGLQVTPDAPPTGPDGTSTVTVPYESAMTITAQRGDIHLGETFATQGDLAVAADGLAIPGTEIAVTVTVEGEPVSDADIALGGDQVAVTDASGSASVRMPLNPLAGDTLTASRGDLQARTSSGASTGWLWLLAGLTSAGIGAMVIVNVLRRRTGDDLAERLLLATVRGATVLQRRLHATGVAIREFVHQPDGRDRRDRLARLLSRGRSAVESLRDNLRNWPVVGSLLARFANVEAERKREPRTAGSYEWLAGKGEESRDRPVTGPTTAPSTDSTTVDDAWDRFTGMVDARASDTPSEVARRAREEGYPSQPVDRITATYLEYTYGQASIGDEDAESIRTAIHALEREGTR